MLMREDKLEYSGMDQGLDTVGSALWVLLPTVTRIFFT